MRVRAAIIAAVALAIASGGLWLVHERALERRLVASDPDLIAGDAALMNVAARIARPAFAELCRREGLTEWINA